MARTQMLQKLNSLRRWEGIEYGEHWFLSWNQCLNFPSYYPFWDGDLFYCWFVSHCDKSHWRFESHIHYACIIWGQNVCTINRLFILQKKALRLIHFKERNAHTVPLFFRSKIMKLPDKIKIENCLFISKYVNNKLPPIFNSWFIFSSTFHNYETSFAAKVHLKIPTVTTATYG